MSCTSSISKRQICVLTKLQATIQQKNVYNTPNLGENRLNKKRNGNKK